MTVLAGPLLTTKAFLTPTITGLAYSRTNKTPRFPTLHVTDRSDLVKITIFIEIRLYIYGLKDPRRAPIFTNFRFVSLAENLSYMMMFIILTVHVFSSVFYTVVMRELLSYIFVTLILETISVLHAYTILIQWYPFDKLFWKLWILSGIGS